MTLCAPIQRRCSETAGTSRACSGQEAEPRQPSLSAAHWRLGLLLEQLGRKPEAIVELQQAVKLDANSPAKAELKHLK